VLELLRGIGRIVHRRALHQPGPRACTRIGGDEMKRTKLPPNPAEQLRAMIAATCKPGLAMLLYAHDEWCPAGENNGGECCCEPDVFLVEEVAPNAESAVRN
jgi:hypothetical protein